MNKYDVVVIGSGLGGLECAYTLAKNGMSVCVLERTNVVGGCLQTFKRGQNVFDTGFHYVGGLQPGGPLHRLFDYFDLLDLPWVRMDDCFDEVTVNDKTVYFAQGHEQFIEQMSASFPKYRAEIKQYTALLKQVGDHIFDNFKPRSADSFYATSLFAQSAKTFLSETISNPELRDCLAGTSLKMELSDNLPLYTYAQINNSFIESAWRIKGGGEQIAQRLTESIRAMGGELRLKAEVTELIEIDGAIGEIEINGEERIGCKVVISNAHPAHTLSLVKNSSHVRRIYRNRINNMENTFGIFTANIRLKPGFVPYCNHNKYVYDHADLWHYDDTKTDRVLASYYPDAVASDGTCTQIDLLTPMTWREVAEWADAPMGKRGQSYVDMKQAKTEACVKLASKRIPQLAEAIDRDFTSTPLSYEHYTKTSFGSAYGLRKDYTNPMLTILTPKTPIPNLFLTGQNLNLHGILGVSMTSFFTVAELLGMETATKDLFIND
ncbi:MAG: NAD(P)/FAD-dependent oxidoreductase [Paludibacteraceae bacterium]|nr:NAD(P)/FAD-dependent oxidoreductase [Paludibacteraceae bacterium]